MSTSSTGVVRQQRTFLGHPVGLYILFFTEMWERFSYYGMRALLIPYMINYFRWLQRDASTTYKVYTSFVYVTPILGGYLADRFLGNRRAVIIGALLMAIGHFLMAFEEYAIFYAALVFLIMGNGFFKPNMSTQVGRLYPANDGRRDGAYTIFYMGINLGAFLSPIVCGWLQENTVGGYHSGFTMAGIGMVAGLVIYLLGQPLIKEIDVPVLPGAKAEEAKKAVVGPDADLTDAAAAREIVQEITTTAQHRSGETGITATPPPAPPAGAPLTEAEAERAPSSLGILGAAIPIILILLGGGLILASPALWFFKIMDLWDAVMLGIGGGCCVLMGYVAEQVRGGVRDRIVAILILGIFVMFFWAAFEQAGNVLNLWADKHTDRYLLSPAPPAELKPPPVSEDAPKGQAAEAPPKVGFFERFVNMFRLKPRQSAAESNWLKESFDPVPTASFQSINALAIFVLAPVFAWMWVVLDRKGWQPSIPMKMVFGLLFMSASMGIMIAAANGENRPSSTPILGNNLPAPLTVGEGNKVMVPHEKGPPTAAHAGRLTYDSATKTLHLLGVLPDNEALNLIEETAPEAFRKKVAELKKESATIDGEKVKQVQVQLDSVPPGFDMQYSAIKPSVVTYDPAKQTLTAFAKIADKEEKGLLVAAGDPDFRETMRQLYLVSNKNVVSSWWLFWVYILATLGELCLSPVGLSMVSKLAPMKFATMLMGVWMLTSAFGNFAAGALGEIWGTIPPVEFFLLATVVVGVAALVLFVLVRLVVGTMHGVK
jgi:POT family proton-dependent oligopeptide transporter